MRVDEDIIYNLINVKKFHEYSFSEKVILKEKGRPLPDINLVANGLSRGKSYKRQFNREIYSRNKWICGCSRKNALYCFACVLFNGERLWSQVGVTDLVHLSDKIKKHENSKAHMHNQMEFALLGNVNIAEQLDSSFRLDIQKHNEKVAQNRYALSKIIDCIKFCGACELTLHGRDECVGLFRGLVNFSAELDKVLDEHLKKNPVFESSSEEIRNDLLDCMLEICRESIISEIKTAPFLSIRADETTDVSAKSQLAVVFRYIQNSEPVERFWGYLVLEKVDANTINEKIRKILDPVVETCPEKLIAQSYDGGVMSGQYLGVQAKIKEKYPLAHFIHCYAHQLNSIMSNATSVNPQVKVFFGNLNDILTFFSTPQQALVLDRVVKNKIPPGTSTSWNFNMVTVNTVFEHRDSLIECMEEIESNVTNRNAARAASRIRQMLHDPIFVFWLNFFHLVLPHVDILFDQLQQRKIDPNLPQHAINLFGRNIARIRTSIDDVIEEANRLIYHEDPEPPLRKMRRLDSQKSQNRISAIEVCDVIINTAYDRLSFTVHLQISSLFFSENFYKYINEFPSNALDVACTSYPGLNNERLRNELSVIYSISNCRNLKGIVPFLKFIMKNNLEETFCETKKLLQILATIPMTTSESDRCFSTLKGIKTFLRNSMREDRLKALFMGEDKLNALSMLSIEKKMIRGIQNFNEKVIDKFASKKSRGIELIYKNKC